MFQAVIDLSPFGYNKCLRPTSAVPTMSRSDEFASSGNLLSSVGSACCEGRGEIHILSINLYRTDKLKSGSPAHWSLTIGRCGEKKADIFHTPKLFDFSYEHSSRPLECNLSYGRSELILLSSSNRRTAEQILTNYGTDDRNLPQGSANCQDWTVGALNALEREGLVDPATGKYWQENIGSSNRYIGERLQRDNRSWVPKKITTRTISGPADSA